MRKIHRWYALDWTGKVIAKSGDRRHLFHMLEVLGLSPYSTPIARITVHDPA